MSRAPRLLLIAASLALLAVPGVSRADTLTLSPGIRFERGRVIGEQWIDTARIDESGDYRANHPWGLGLGWRTGMGEGFRWGAGVWTPTMYGGCDRRRCNDPFRMGLLFDLYADMEWSRLVTADVGVLISARAGMPLLFPAGELSNEIQRLQAEGVGVWSVPRVGYLAGGELGVRYALLDTLWVRTTVLAQWNQHFLFLTRSKVDGLIVRKNWRTASMRIVLNLAVELDL